MIGQRAGFAGSSFSESLENSKIQIIIYIKKNPLIVNITNSEKFLVVKRESRLIMIILAYLLEIICVLLTYWQFQVLSCSHDPLPAGHSSRHGQFSKQISWAPAYIMKQLTINN